MPTTPAYLSLPKVAFEEKVAQANALLRTCTVCPRKCGVDRTEGQHGFCGAGLLPKVASFGPHFGEEAPLVARYGSGTIFFSYCTMRCAFCQNYTISQLAMGDNVSCAELAGMMLGLQRRGCHNINLVSPTHYAPQILEAISIASCQGLHIPVVYNSGGYDSRETLRILEGVIDIYMPDAKYGDDETALILSHAPEYTRYNKAAIIEMQRQVGDLVCENGIAVRGQIIRHLVLPSNLAKTEAVTDFIAKEISIDAYVNIMAQYRWPASVLPPEIIKKNYPELLRSITMAEYRQAIQYARDAGLHRGFTDNGRC